MSCVAGPVAPQHPPAASWPLAAAAGSAGDGDDDDPAFAAWHTRSVHEADLEPINVQKLKYACEPCKVAFSSMEAARAHHLLNPNILFLRVRVDVRSGRFILVEVDSAAVRAARRAAAAPSLS